MPLDKYDFYWNTYSKLKDPRSVHAIWQRVDRLSKEDFRRFTGEFYTPVEYAQKALDYLERTVGEDWWNRGYRLWDMAAGTGNLEYNIPEDALPHCYISTLLKADADYCASLYPQATVFQYDYLNDDVPLFFQSGLDILKMNLATKMPRKLVEELSDSKLKWIIFINPPFATANVGARDSDLNKDSVSMTEVRRLMAQEGLLETSRELFSQFLWRLSREFESKQAYLGMFSKIKYVNANNDQKMRDTFFRFKFERGFCFPSTAFQGNKGKFPVGFLIWNLGTSDPLDSQKIWLDVFNQNVEKIGRKHIPSVNRQDALSKWVERPRTSRVLPPLTNAITVANSHKDVRDAVAEDFLFSLMAKRNDFANQNFTALLSGPYVSAGALSVTPSNFEKCMVWHTVRRLPKATWLNDRDQWMQPSLAPSEEFTNDSVVWSAFSNSNQTASLSDVSYKGKIYDLPNQLFPFKLLDLQTWNCSVNSIRDSMGSSRQDRFLANWLAGKTLSKEAQGVVDSARILYEYFFENLAALPWPKYKIKRWDVGLYQIRRCLTDAGKGGRLLADLAHAQSNLGAKLLPQIIEFGFIQGEEIFFGENLVSESNA